MGEPLYMQPQKTCAAAPHRAGSVLGEATTRSSTTLCHISQQDLKTRNFWTDISTYAIEIDKYARSLMTVISKSLILRAKRYSIDKGSLCKSVFCTHHFARQDGTGSRAGLRRMWESVCAGSGSNSVRAFAVCGVCA